MAEGPGQLIAGQYRLAEEIGRGGFGVVWRARDERLHRDVAAKELFLPTYLAEDQRQERRSRSLREARSAARIVHPAAVTVYDVVEHDGCPWIIMELIDGRALNAIVKTDGPLPPLRAAWIGLEILGALQAAHAAGVVHRDVKPGNVLINDRRVVLTDFGIATIEGDPTLTHSGFVMGAPAYTAPERARGEHAIPASDLWSLGATLFYAVEGHRPYPGPNANAVFHAILNGDPARPRHAGALTPIIEGLLRKDVAERLTAAEAATQLRHFLKAPDKPLSDSDETLLRPVSRAEGTHPNRHRTKARPGRRGTLLVAVGAAVALPLTLGTLFWPGGDSQDPAPRNHLSAQAAQPHELAVVYSAPDHLNAVAFSPDRTTLAAAGEDRIVRLWNVADRRLVATLRGHSFSVFSLAFSPDGRLLASGGYDRRVILWDVGKRKQITTLPSGGPDEAGVNGLTFSPDGTLLAGSASDHVRIWKVGTYKVVESWDNYPREAQYVAAFGQGDGLTIVGTERLRTWRAGRDPEMTVQGRTGVYIRTMAISPNGNIVACGGDDRIWLWAKGKPKKLNDILTDHAVNGLAFSPDGRSLAGASGHQVVIWNMASRSTTTLRGHTDTVSSVAYSRDGRILATTSYDRTLRFWSTGTP